MAEWSSALRIIETAMTVFGRIDAVVNNAGILRDRFFFNMDPDEWKAVIDVHSALRCALELCVAVRTQPHDRHDYRRWSRTGNAPQKTSGDGAGQDRASGQVSGQIFAVRANEIFLMSQSRPLRSLHAGGGWTMNSIAERAIPALRANFYPLERSQDVFSWDPI